MPQDDDVPAADDDAAEVCSAIERCIAVMSASERAAMSACTITGHHSPSESACAVGLPASVMLAMPTVSYCDAHEHDQCNHSRSVHVHTRAWHGNGMAGMAVPGRLTQGPGKDATKMDAMASK